MTAAARQVGHTISFYITLALMLLVGGVIAREAIAGPRSWAPTKRERWGPTVVMFFAACLIMAEPTRHVITDANIWPWCGNNPAYDRVNSTDPFPAQCQKSATQYVCTQVCCVSTWQPASAAADASFSWTPPSADFYPDGPLPGPFATQRADGSVYFPPGFPKSASAMPYSLYEASAAAPLVFYETGAVNPLRRSTPATGCVYGVNQATGYCFLTNQSLSYEAQLASLPLADPTKPFNATTNPHSCGCDGCVPQENWSHLSVVGVLSSLVCTYFGFFLLTIAVGWNANILKKLKRIPQQWSQLRAASRR